MTYLATKIKDHFLNPRNVGKIADPSAIGISGDPGAGSGIRLFMKVAGDGKIERLSYQIFNNAPAIAPASAFTELAVGKTVGEAADLNRKDIMAFLECDDKSVGNLRFDILEAFESCVEALHGADVDDNFESGLNKRREEEAKKSAKTSPAPNSDGAIGGRPKLIVMQLIQDVLDSEIRPAVAMDGGDVELMDVQEKQVLLKLHGHCVGCSSSNTTMRFFIEDRLRELVDPSLEVIDVTEFEGETHAPPGYLPI